MFLGKAGFIPLALWYEIKFHSPDLHILQLIDVNWTLKWLMWYCVTARVFLTSLP